MLWEDPPHSLEVPPAKGATTGEACRGSALGNGQRPAVRRHGGRIQPLPKNSCTFRASPFPSASTEGALLVRPPQGGGDITLEAARRDTGAGRAGGGWDVASRTGPEDVTVGTSPQGSRGPRAGRA